MADDTWPADADAYQTQVAYNENVGKWIALVNTVHDPGKAGFRGAYIFDVTNPAKPTQVGRFSSDGGDPDRKLQSGLGPHRNYYDGGKYAFLSASPDETFRFSPQDKLGGFGLGLEIVDMSDPTRPTLVSHWYYPGMRGR